MLSKFKNLHALHRAQFHASAIAGMHEIHTLSLHDKVS